MKLKLNSRKLKRTKKMRGGENPDDESSDQNDDNESNDQNEDESSDPISDVACFLNSERGREMANLFSEFNMSDKDWAQLKRNFISLSEKLIEDVAFKPAMAVLANKVNASLEYINDASDEIENKSEDEDKPDCIDTLLDSMGFDDDEIESKNESREEDGEGEDKDNAEDKDKDNAEASTEASTEVTPSDDTDDAGADDAEDKDKDKDDAEDKDKDKDEDNDKDKDKDKDTDENKDSTTGGRSKKRTPKSRKTNKRVTFKKH